MTKNIDSTMYEVIVQEDPETGELLIPLPPELMTQMGWKEGDNIEIGLDEEGRYILKKT